MFGVVLIYFSSIVKIGVIVVNNIIVDSFMFKI